MLGLQFETTTSWADIAKDNLSQILTDHAFLEQKPLQMQYQLLSIIPKKLNLLKK